MTDISRRAFLGGLGAAAAALSFDPERALWVPGQKSIFLIGQPERRIETAATLEEAVSRGLHAFNRRDGRIVEVNPAYLGQWPMGHPWKTTEEAQAYLERDGWEVMDHARALREQAIFQASQRSLHGRGALREQAIFQASQRSLHGRDAR